MSESLPPEDEEQEAESDLVTLAEVTAGGGEVDLGDSNGEVSGDVCGGGTIRGRGHLIVKGNVLGDAASKCEIEVAETLVIEQNVSHAVVRARHVVIVGDVSDSDLHSDLGVEVRGSFRASNVSLGYRTGEIQTLKQFRTEYQKIRRELSEIEVRVASSSRHFVRNYPQVDLRLGNILIPTQKELKVDLGPFYDALDDKSSEGREKALQEFYLKVVVGMLTRTNKGYISQNPSRHKIFLKVIEELRGHLLVVRRADALREDLGHLEATKQEILEALNKPVPLHLRVTGEVLGPCRVRALHLNDVRDTPSGAVEMTESWAETKLQQGSGGWELESWSLDGRKSAIPAPSPLKKGRFALEDGIVCWAAP